MVDKLGGLLVKDGIITARQLDEALQAQRIYGGRFGTNHVELGFLNIDTLAHYLGVLRRYPVATEADLAAAPAGCISLLTPEQSEKHHAIPFHLEGRKAKVAFASPDPEHIDAVQFMTGLRI